MSYVHQFTYIKSYTLGLDGCRSALDAQDGQGLEMEELQASHAAELQRLRAEHQVAAPAQRPFRISHGDVWDRYFLGDFLMGMLSLAPG